MITFQDFKELVLYQDALNLMENTINAVLKNPLDEKIFLMEHDHVYTLGTGATKDDIINLHGIPLYEVGRGGKVTYHGPGQRMIYPILNLENKKKDIKLYVKALEEWIISAFSIFHIKAFTIDGMVGIWTIKNMKYAKIASIGVRVRKWVTYHGAAVNVLTDLTKFSGIIPCGIKDVQMASINDFASITMEEFDDALKKTLPNFLLLLTPEMKI